MKTYIKILSSFLITILLLIPVGCSKEDVSDITEPLSGKKAENFNALMASLPSFNQPEEVSEPDILDEDPPARDDEEPSLECFTTYYKHAPGFNDMLALDPSTDVIFPGAILKGESIPTGEYIPIVADRAAITLSASLTNINGSPVVKVTDPKLSTVREEVKSILDQEVTGATPARINFEISEVYTKEQLNLAIGANYRSAAAKVSASFNFTNSTYRYKYVLKYFQVYYTIDMDPPQNPSDLFTDTPDLNALGSTSPVYVATVTYGRMIIYTIESNSTKTEIDAAFSASFASGDGSIDAEYQKTIDESSVKALVIGGSGSDAAQVVNGPKDVYNYITEGGNYSKESPGAPLSYKLRYLKQGTPIARVVLASEYAVRECDVAYPVYNVTLISLSCDGCEDDGNPRAELYGIISGQMYQARTVVNSTTFWRYKRDNTFKLGKGATKNVGKSARTEFYRPDYANDYIRVYGDMMEADLGCPFDCDDDFGSASRNVYLHEIKLGEPPLYINISFSGLVDAKFRFERVQ
ncbi:thiol-activated cytolysin family protein [Costertonia aggregata]|uniref:Thiol-activated cytolysin family protein n=1 Tax=Costertonia aggregata TaxID=343403 RepID=A0A7H9ASI4_9FLAO|nr:thiol-activated cytolysin family protein [Costertonia aggregata]QLG46400.1 thiol-activated cytolysin family protein [Costertonia aggregata]